MGERMDERALLDWLQYRFPIAAEPFQALAREHSMPVEAVLERVQSLHDRGLLRAIRGFFDARRLGYASTLVAARIPAAELDAVAARVSAHPGVSHNYAREHEYNLWFTFTVPAASDMAHSVTALLRGVDDFLLLPALRVFKIDARFAMSEDQPQSEHDTSAGGHASTPRALDEIDRRTIRALNRPLPVAPRPFVDLAAQLELTESELLERARVLLERGIMRRYGAVLNHRRAGFAANGMTGWAVPEVDVASVGRAFAKVPGVSHCYQRPTYPSWPYSLFTMIHGASREYVDGVVAEMARTSGLRDFAVLYSTHEYKKEPVAYFDPAMDVWAVAGESQ